MKCHIEVYAMVWLVRNLSMGFAEAFAKQQFLHSEGSHLPTAPIKNFKVFPGHGIVSPSSRSCLTVSPCDSNRTVFL